MYALGFTGRDMFKDRQQADPSSQLLSTGKVAEICSVSRDTVLKWVKSGKVPFYETPGGQYRVPRSALDAILKNRTATAISIRSETTAVYCWEYHASGGPVKEGCKACVVYRTRAQRCFDMAKLPGDIGFAGTYCETTCEVCDYYKLVHGRNLNVIVVTRDSRVSKRLKKADPSLGFNLQIVNSEYNCSLAIEDFRPDFVFVDNSLGALRRDTLISNLHADHRLPIVRVVLNHRPRNLPKDLEKMIFAYIKGPITGRALSRIVEDFQAQKDEFVGSAV
jgi:excisionase family DNA binding protein